MERYPGQGQNDPHYQSPQQPMYPQQPTQYPSQQFPGQPQYPSQQYPGQPPYQPPPQPTKKRGCSIPVIITSIVIIVVLVGCIGAYAALGTNRSAATNTTATTDTSSQSSTASNQPAPTTAPQTWTTTHTFSGSGIKKTGTITAPDDWKLLWKCKPGSFYGGSYNVIVTVYNTDGSLADVAINAMCQKGTTSGDTEEHTGGSVYLDVNSEGDWTLTVQELK